MRWCFVGCFCICLRLVVRFFLHQLRLEGTNKEEARKVLKEVKNDPQFSRLQLLQEDDFDKAAQLAVKVSSVVDAASKANLKVQILSAASPA